MNPRIPIAVVGLNFGRHIVRQLVENPADGLFQIAAVCDQNRDRADAVAQKMGVRACYDLDEVLADDDIPAVGLFVGPVGRADMIRRCVDAGKDVLTTKPFETNPQAALEVLQYAETRGRIVHLNSPSPLLPPDLAQIRAWREEFDLGRPVGARADVWVPYHESEDGSWYDDPQKCPVAPIFRLGVYLINDLARIFGSASRVQVLHSRLITRRPTPDNAQLGILFENGALANIFASFCINDGDHYRDGLTLNFQNGTIYRSVGPQRSSRAAELSLVMNADNGRTIAAQSIAASASGAYQWDAFARAVRGESLENVVSPHEVVAGLQIIDAMARADAGSGVAEVEPLP